VSHVRRGSIVQLALFAAAAALLGVLLASPSPHFGFQLHWLPISATREAGRIHFVFWFVTGICVFIFAIVAAVLGYAVWKFRRPPDDDSDGPPIHGHTGLEIAWTAIPFLLVTAIAIVSAIVLAKDDAAGANPLRVDVVAQQFKWTFYYGCSQGPTGIDCTKAKPSDLLMLPVNRSVVLHMTSKDVIHSFWVPEFSQKQDLVPGIHPTLHITPDRIGTYPVICTELCGLGHALMRTQAKVVSTAAFAKWLKAGQPKAAPGGTSGSAAAIFTGQGCGACHTLAAAAAHGTIGPDLDKLKAEAARAGKPLAPFIRESIVSPNAYIEPGFPRNVMPQNFAQKLTTSQLTSLVQFLVASVKKGAK
jgi:cytochrome c oxidase subunit 2